MSQRALIAWLDTTARLFGWTVHRSSGIDGYPHVSVAKDRQVHHYTVLAKDGQPNEAQLRWWFHMENTVFVRPSAVSDIVKVLTADDSFANVFGDRVGG